MRAFQCNTLLGNNAGVFGVFAVYDRADKITDWSIPYTFACFSLQLQKSKTSQSCCALLWLLSYDCTSNVLGNGLVDGYDWIGYWQQIN